MRIYVRQPPAERFWAKVDKSGECWVWTASTNACGYGRFHVSHNPPIWNQAHRYAWQSQNGTIPLGLSVLHHCDNPPCVRLDHLFLGTQVENMADAVAKGRLPSGDKSFSRLKSYRLPRGEWHAHAKLTEVDVRAIRLAYGQGGITHAVLAKRYGLNPAYISKLVNRKRWAHVA